MSAICGVVGVDGSVVGESDLGGVLHALRPLMGSDGRACGARVGRMGVALGAREVIRCNDRGLCVVADAVLDCGRDLRAALRAPPGASDGELILAAYERWGEACLDRLSGEFAFAVADGRRGGVFVARDQIGARPLQVHRRGGIVAFATTALSLCALKTVGHELDRERVAEWLALRADTERTFVAGVQTFPAAHCAWIDDAGYRIRRYWRIDTDHIVERPSPEYYASELRDAFDDAVERRLPRSGTLGVLLSGGLDSTSVAATAARLRRHDAIRTYTAAPPAGWHGATEPGVDPDESGLVRELQARYPNLRASFISGDMGPLLARYDERFAAGSPPPRNPCNELWVTEAERRAAADGVATLLTGHRGNAFFSGDDPYWLAELLLRGRLGAVRREVAALASARGSSPLRAGGRQLAWQLLPVAAHRMRDNRLARRAGISPVDGLGFAAPGLQPLVRLHADALLPPSRRIRRQHMLRVLTWSGFIAESRAVRNALAGIRTLDPTGDIRVVAVCAKQPAWARRRVGRNRAVVRDAMADRLPPSIAERSRRGLQLPDWLDRMTERRGELFDELEAAREHPWCRELLDLDRVEAALHGWPDARRAREQPRRTVLVYRHDLFRALLMCRYLRFFEAHRRAISGDASPG